MRTKSPKVLENITIKRLYVLLPCIEEGYFLMLQITPAELVLPHISLNVDMKEYDQEDELLENIKAEVTSSLNKIPFQEYYDPFEHSSGSFPPRHFIYFHRFLDLPPALGICEAFFFTRHKYRHAMNLL